MKNVLHYIPLAITMLLSSCGKEFRRRKVKYTISSDRHKPAFLFFSCRELGKAAYLNNNTQPLSNYTMKTIYYVLLLLVLASCNNKSQDTGILNGEIICIEEHAPEKEVEFKELTLKGLNFGNLAIHDSLAFFMNPKLQSKWFQLFNRNYSLKADNSITSYNLMLAATLIQWVLSYLEERAFVANLFIMGTRLYQISISSKTDRN